MRRHGTQVGFHTPMAPAKRLALGVQPWVSHAPRLCLHSAFARGLGKSPFPLWLLVLWCAAVPTRAQLPEILKSRRTLTSLSHQFVIHADLDPNTGVPQQAMPEETFHLNIGTGPRLTLFSMRESGSTNVIEIDPKALAVTCERVKKAILGELAMNDQWRGSVHVFVAPSNRPRQPVEILPTRYGDGWHYKVALPARCDWIRLVRGLAEVILLELANRDTRPQLVQPPLWLTEGLCGLLVAEHGRTLVTEPNAYIVVSGRKAERLNLARQLFREISPATFNELSWPDSQQLADPEAWKRYQAASQLFTQELLNEPDGRKGIQDFLRVLPQNLNWQTSFLRAFHPRFLTLLDVERWWAVAIADFQSRDPSLQWSRERVARQLDTVIHEATEVRTGTNGPITRKELPLSQLVANWEFSDQRDVLARKANQLQLLHVHAPPNLRPLIADYFRILDAYVRDRQPQGGGKDGRGDVAKRKQILARETSKRLAELETRIEAIQARP